MEIVLRQATEDDVTELATLNKQLVVDQGSRNPYTASEERFGNREVAVDVLATNPDGQKFWAHIGFTPYFTSMKKR